MYPRGVPAPESVLACLLPIRVDAAAIASELDAILEPGWVTHFNVGVHDGGWEGIALRAPGGDPRTIYPDLTGHRPIEDTPLLEAMPRTRDWLASLPARLGAVRFLRLAPGGSIRRHRDPDLGIDRGEVRLHAPIRTHPDVRFEVGGLRLVMAPDELWYADFGEEHEVRNPSPVARIHLVIDAYLDEPLRDAIARAPVAIPRFRAS